MEQWMRVLTRIVCFGGVLMSAGCGASAPPPAQVTQTGQSGPNGSNAESTVARREEEAETSADDEAPGWQSIEKALHSVYGTRDPAAHYAPKVSMTLGGEDPIDGTTIYRSSDGSHWHYVTFGMSELYEKVSADPSESGWGFEFTFRLACAADDTLPPTWPIQLLNNLARYVFQSSRPFEAGHRIPLNSSIHADVEVWFAPQCLLRMPSSARFKRLLVRSLFYNWSECQKPS